MNPQTVILLLLSVSPCLSQGVFTSIDIGRATPAGKTVAVTNGFDLTSATGDVWGYQDNFRFLYQRVTGDFDFVARLQDLAGAAYWTKAGLMLRSDLTDYAQNGFMIATRSSGWGRYFFTGRPCDFCPSFSYFQGSFTRVSYPNAWLRLVRVGGDIISLHSTNGFDWTQIGNLDFLFWERTTYVGMAVANHPDSGSTPGTARFRDILLSGGGPGAPVIISQPQSQTVNPAAQVRFGVTAVGGGAIRYQWFHDGDAIPGATNSAVMIASATPPDAGKYTCVLQNEFGTVSSWAGMMELASAAEPWDGILAEVYSRVYGGQVAYMINATNYPGAPFSASRPLRCEISNSGDDTGGRLRGFLCPTVTGNYTFYIAADERGELWLSSDDNPARKQLVAQCYYYVGQRMWDYYEEQVSNPIRLEAGRRYYVEAVYKGDGAPNHCSVAWRLPNGTLEGPIPVSHFQGLPASISADGSLPLSNTFVLQVTGSSNSAYVVEASTDLVNWSSVMTNRVPFTYEEALTIQNEKRFFRAKANR